MLRLKIYKAPWSVMAGVLCIWRGLHLLAAKCRAGVGQGKKGTPWGMPFLYIDR